MKRDSPHSLYGNWFEDVMSSTDGDTEPSEKQKKNFIPVRCTLELLAKYQTILFVRFAKCMRNNAYVKRYYCYLCRNIFKSVIIFKYSVIFKYVITFNNVITFKHVITFRNVIIFKNVIMFKNVIIFKYVTYASRYECYPFRISIM